MKASVSQHPNSVRIRSDDGLVRHRILGFHGYSLSPHSLLPLALKCMAPGLEWILPRLPGHGEIASDATGDTLDLDSLLKFRDRIIAEIRPQLLIGFSLGARIALSTGTLPCIAISAPVLKTFEREDREEVLTFLNPRRVRETSAMEGLNEALNGLPIEAARTGSAHVFYGQRDLRSVRDGIPYLQDIPRLSIRKIDRCNHGDICEMPELGAAIRFQLLQLDRNLHP